MFPDVVYYNNERMLQKNIAVHCRKNENLCGESGFLYEQIKMQQQCNNKYKKQNNNKYIKKMHVYDLVKNKTLKEIDKLEKEMVDVFQKMKRHNLR
jgi:hypothetical protein